MMPAWTLTRRAFADFVGLAPEAEWLLDSSAGPGAAGPLFRRRSLADAAEPPFAFLLSPDPSSTTTGQQLREALDAVRAGMRLDEQPFRFNMSVADRARLDAGGTAGALCDQAFINALAGSDFALMPKVMRLSSALRGEAAPQDRRETFPGDLSVVALDGLAEALATAFECPDVVLGVIDDEFAIAHPRLRLAGGATRIASYWDQEAPAEPAGTVPFGRELTNPALNALLLGWVGKPLCEFYAQDALAAFYPIRRSLLPRNASHGTHVLDLLAGEAPGKADKRPVVAVKLPRAAVLDTSGAHLEKFLLAAVHHIVARAAMLYRDPDPAISQPKVVIVASYGFFGGPLDGDTQLERTLDAVIAAHDGRVQIVLPSGNGRLARAHGVRGGASVLRTVDWRVPAGDRTPSVMEIWSEPPAGAAATVALQIVTPDGLTSGALSDVDLAGRLTFEDASGAIFAEAVCAHPPLHPGRRLFLIWLAPTADPLPGVTPKTGLAPAGVWTVRLTQMGAPVERDFGVWIRRDDSLPGHPRLGLQSSIERAAPAELGPPRDSDAAEADLPGEGATRKGTISAMATGRLSAVAGGFALADLRAAPGSAGGPVADPPSGAPGWRQGPDCMAPSQVSRLRGVKAANFFGGAKVGFSGTSVAAPLLARALADALAQAAPIGQAAGRVEAARLAVQSEGVLPKDWKPSADRGGAGRFVDPAMRARVFRYDERS